MEFTAFLTRIIDDGIAEIKQAYPAASAKYVGAIAGFEACRGKQILELGPLLAEVRQATIELQRAHSACADLDAEAKFDYWRQRMHELQVEWVCNVISAALVNQGITPIIEPTTRGVFKAASVLGITPKSHGTGAPDGAV